MGKFIDLSGQRFGKLVVIERAPDFGTGRERQTMWKCRCDCGNTVDVRSHSLRNGHTQSCGCLINERRHIKHGLSHSRIYQIYKAMIQRCYNSNSEHYDDYAGRGIVICDEWRHDFLSFRDWAVASGYQDDLTIDRIDVNGNYDPENCRWADRKTQTVNRRGTVRIEYNNQIHTIEEWSQITGIAAGTLRTRLYTRKWSVEKSLTTPISEANTIRDLEQAKGRVCCRFWIASDIAEKIKCLGENDVDKTSEVVESALRAYLSRK